MTQSELDQYRAEKAMRAHALYQCKSCQRVERVWPGEHEGFPDAWRVVEYFLYCPMCCSDDEEAIQLNLFA